MDITLVVNPGSSSKKYALYAGEKLLFTAKYESTNEGFLLCTSVNNEQQLCEGLSENQFNSAVVDVIERAKRSGVIKDELEITKVGVRLVAPGTYFTQHRVIDESFLGELRGVAPKAPLHTPLILSEIEAVREVLPRAKLIAASDSDFHTTVPSWRTCYSLANTLENDVRRFGYHGLSVASVGRRLALVFGGDMPPRVIVIHVGNGVSVTALLEGQSIATTMGFTPGSGLMMGSRAGDIDPGALIYMLDTQGLSGEAAHKYIQTEGGFKGMTGVSDIRSVLERAANKDEAAINALSLFTEGLAEAVLKLAVPLKGLDAIVCTGTAFERNGDLRQRVLSLLPFDLIDIDTDLNDQVFKVSQIISTKDSKVKVAVIPTDEMGEITRVVEGFKI